MQTNREHRVKNESLLKMFTMLKHTSLHRDSIIYAAAMFYNIVTWLQINCALKVDLRRNVKYYWMNHPRFSLLFGIKVVGCQGIA